jgi:hypothetical protein
MECGRWCDTAFERKGWEGADAGWDGGASRLVGARGDVEERRHFAQQLDRVLTKARRRGGGGGG